MERGNGRRGEGMEGSVGGEMGGEEVEDGGVET